MWNTLRTPAKLLIVSKVAYPRDHYLSDGTIIDDGAQLRHKLYVGVGLRYEQGRLVEPDGYVPLVMHFGDFLK